MKTKRLINDENLEPFYKGIDDFCEAHLPQDLPMNDENLTGSKIFSDPIESYVSLYSWEVAIIDTLLFQRLRNIKQLGVAFLVYPTLSYTRFEHSIGVVGRLKQLLTSLQENLSEEDNDKKNHVSNIKNQIIIRLAALCHDIGHCIFSHLSEAIIQELPGNDVYPSSVYISEVFSKYAGRRIPFSEIFSSCILTSPQFVNFLSKIGVPGITNEDLAFSLAKKISNLIFGLPLPNDGKSLYFGQIMNSGLDIDKLDYMMRESLFSGITLGISLEWLLKKITVCTLPAEQVPTGMANRINNFNKNTLFFVLSLKKGGQFAFEEFCIARLALHEKIYLHPKIRAAEAQLKLNLEAFIESMPSYKEAHRWLYLKESMREYSAQSLPELAPMSIFSGNTGGKISSLNISFLSERKLLFRAFAFGWHNAMAEPIFKDYQQQETYKQQEQSGTDKLMAYIQDNNRDFADRIQTNYQEIIETLASDELPESTPEIIVDLPKFATIQQGHDSLHFEYSSRLSLHWTMPIDKIVEYYHTNRALAYVFSTKPHLPYVLLAAEKAIWDLFEVVYEQETFINPRVSDKAKEIKIELDNKGYYAEAQSLKPISDFLTSVQAQKLIANVAHKLSSYESRAKRNVTPASVTTYISQFPSDLQEVALEWLQTIELLHPEILLQDAIKEILDSELFEGCKRIALCPLGSLSDSATRIAYDLRPIGSDNAKLIINTLYEAFEYDYDGYIIYDDNINTGLQALNIQSAWLGIPLPEHLILKEDHVVKKLSKRQQEKLKKKPLALSYAVATEGACEKLVKEMVDIFGFSPDSVLCKAGEYLEKNNRVFSGKNSKFQHAKKLVLKQFLEEVALEILKKEGKTESKAPEKALGYALSEAMVVFPYNCPTMTITSLWITGDYKGNKWLPLVERGRRSHPTTGELLGEDG